MKALEIESLEKTYSNGFKALKKIDLDIEKGDFFALLGPNGAGKSTTINILCSLVNKTSGKIKILGIDIDKDFEEAKRKIGIVPQEFNFSIFEKVEQIVMQQAGFYGIDKKTAKQRTEKYLKKLGLWDKKDTPSRALSGGMKRRLMIARALVHEPELLILDEPTAGVDIELRRSMWEFIKELNKSGTTIILTTHYLEEAEELCKNIAIIDKGKIIENTSMKKLLTKLDSETFILDVKEEITNIPKTQDFEITLKDNHTIEVEIKKKDNINELFKFLDKNKIEILSMRNKSNRLEELFLKLVENNNGDEK